MSAQAKFNSPYSRYGLGDLFGTALNQQTGIGGVANAYSDPLHLNATNPAAIGGLDLTALEGGFYFKSSTYKTSGLKNRVQSGNLSYLGLGFSTRNTITEALEKIKTKHKIGMALFLEPISSIGYDITTTDTINSEQLIINQYQGDGGYYRFKYGLGYKRKHTSAGVFLGWQFGRGIYENTTLFDTLPAFQNNFRDEIRMNGFVYNLGLQHDIVLKRSENNKEIITRWITLGVQGAPAKDIGINATQLRIRSRGRTANGAGYVDADTLSFKNNVKSEVSLPAQVGFGIMYQELNKWRIGLDLNYQNWSVYRNVFRPDTLANTIQIAAGAEFTPDHLSYNRYSKRIRYRAGVYYRQDPRIVHNKQLTDLGITLGCGFPLILPRQQTSTIHFSLELGKLGGGSLVEENYLRLALAYTLNDNSWFYKRRFE